MESFSAMYNERQRKQVYRDRRTETDAQGKAKTRNYLERERGKRDKG